MEYKYAPAGSDNAYKEGYCTIAPYRFTVSYGANAGNNKYNKPTKKSDVNTYHLDHTISLNEKAYNTVTYNVQFPETEEYASLTDSAQRVKNGTKESDIQKPADKDVPRTKTENGIDYEFSGWYRDAECTTKVDFGGTILENTNYYGKYIAKTQRYTVEYYYDNVLDSTATYTAKPVEIGNSIAEYPNKNKTGFRFDCATVSESKPLTISQDANKNIIKVYYIKKAVRYTADYYLNGTKEKIAESVMGYAKYGETVIVPFKTVDGYTPVNSDAATELTMSEESANIDFYYYKNVKLTAKSATKTYNGEDQNVNGYTVENTVKEQDQPKFSGLEIGAKAKNAGTAVIDASSAVGKIDETGKYLVTEAIRGSLVIEPAELTVVTEDASKEYDGEPLTASGEIKGFVNGEDARLKVTGSQTEVGTSDNTYETTWNEHSFLKKQAKAGNYQISQRVGKLTVLENTNEITVTTTGGTFTYDGKPHKAEVTVSNLPTGYKVVAAESNATATHVTKTPVEANCNKLIIENKQGRVVYDSQSKDNRKLKVTFVPGKIQIDKATLTVTTPSHTKTYDCEPLTAKGTISGFVNGEEATFETTGTQTAVGSSRNTYTLKFIKSAQAGDYEVKSEVGELTVSENTSEITVTTTGGEYTYDGKAHGATVTVSTLPKGYTIEKAESSASVTNVAESPAKATCDTLVIRNAQGEDVTNRLNIKYIDGSIDIKKRNINVASESASKQYDGSVLRADRVAISGDGLAETDELALRFGDGIIEVGKTQNKFEYAVVKKKVLKHINPRARGLNWMQNSKTTTT